jgi:hypothetical protein
MRETHGMTHGFGALITWRIGGGGAGTVPGVVAIEPPARLFAGLLRRLRADTGGAGTGQYLRVVALAGEIAPPSASRKSEASVLRQATLGTSDHRVVFTYHILFSSMQGTAERPPLLFRAWP